MIRTMEWIATFLLILATACGIALTGFVALSAVMRYVFHAPFAFTEELVGLLFAALVFLALPFVTLKRRHIHVTLLSDLFPTSVQRLSNIAGDLLVVLFCVWFGSFAFDFTHFSFELGARTDLSRILLWPWMALMVAASALMGLFTVVLLLRRRSTKHPRNLDVAS